MFAAKRGSVKSNGTRGKKRKARTAFAIKVFALWGLRLFETTQANANNSASIKNISFVIGVVFYVCLFISLRVKSVCFAVLLDEVYPSQNKVPKNFSRVNNRKRPNRLEIVK